MNATARLALKKHHFLETCMVYEGTLYSWGGDDPEGFDCSGLVVECLKASGFLHKGADLTADGLYHKFKQSGVGKPQRGAMAFYLNDKGKAIHVVICLDELFAMGANGGSSRVVDKASAMEYGAFIKRRPIDYRSEKIRFIYLFG